MTARLRGSQGNAEGGNFLEQEPGFCGYEFGDNALTLAIHNEVKVRGRAGEFAAEQVVGRVILKQRLLANGIGRPGRMRIAGAYERREHPTRHRAAVADTILPQPLGGGGGESIGDNPLPVLGQDQGRLAGSALE
jgi:hypothetical protein